MDILPHQSYMVMIHGSRAATQRNRKFLRKITPFHPMIPVDHRELLLPAAPHTHQEDAPCAPVPDQHQPLVPPPQPQAAHPIPQARQLPPAADVVAPPAPPPCLPADAPMPPAAMAAQPAIAPDVPLTVVGRSLPPASVHRQAPAAHPGQDIITIMKQREAQGHVLSFHGY